MVNSTRRNGAPEAFAAAGQRMWDDLHVGLDPAGIALLVEACHTRDRLNGLNRLLRGDVDAWAAVEWHGDVVTLDVSSAMTEARLQGAALRSLLADLPRYRTRRTVPEQGPRAQKAEDALDDEFTLARAARAAKSAGA